MAEAKNPRDARLAPLVLFLGPEEFLFRKMLPVLRRQALEREPETDVHRLSAADYAAGDLESAAQASLFSPSSFVQIEGLGSMNEAFLQDALAYLKSPVEEASVVLHHPGGNRGKKLLDALKKSAAVYDCSSLKKDSDKHAYVVAEFKAARRKIASDAVTALVQAVGSSLAELDSACQQLIQDVPGDVTAQLVNRYYGGRVEATAFKVADAAVAGQTAQALGIARAAMVTGVDPVPLVASIGVKVRSLAKVAGFRGSPGEAAQAFSMAPWQAKNAMADARRWSSPSLVAAVQAVADADYNVKGGSRNPGFVVERLIIELGRLIGRR